MFKSFLFEAPLRNLLDLQLLLLAKSESDLSFFANSTLTLSLFRCDSCLSFSTIFFIYWDFSTCFSSAKTGFITKDKTPMDVVKVVKEPIIEITNIKYIK